MTDEKDRGGDQIRPVNERLFTFSHNHLGVQSQLEVRRLNLEPEDEDDPNTAFLIKTEEGETIGSIDGIFSEDQGGIRTFRASESMNLQREMGLRQHFEPQQVRIPRAVGGTIAELVVRGVVDRWYSSDDVSPFAQQMYENYLTSDPRLEVTKEIIGDNEQRYLVKKKINSTAKGI